MSRYQCPECGSNVLQVTCLAPVTFRFDDELGPEAIETGIPSYEPASDTVCTGCGLPGELRDFDAKER